MENPKVFVKFTGEEPMKTRLVRMGEKVEFKSGDVYLMDFVKAKSTCSRYKNFKVFKPEELTPEEIAKAVSYEKEEGEIEEAEGEEMEGEEKPKRGRKAKVNF